MLCRLGGYHPFDPYGNATEAELQDNMKELKFDFDDEVCHQFFMLTVIAVVRLRIRNATENKNKPAFLKASCIMCIVYSNNSFYSNSLALLAFSRSIHALPGLGCRQQ